MRENLMYLTNVLQTIETKLNCADLTDTINFDECEKARIRTGLKHGLSMDQILLIMDTSFDSCQIHYIITGFKKGLTIEEVEYYANPKFSDLTMSRMLQSLLCGRVKLQDGMFITDKTVKPSELRKNIKRIKR